ncbi:MAG TPA: hypothetical protein DCX12_04515, partial [Chloroflexi bacterium]|nr:hypothetical protein [Chloroflexota bacterium]
MSGRLDEPAHRRRLLKPPFDDVPRRPSRSAPMTLRIAVVCGGPSPEVEVSRLSASQVAGALRSRGHQCTTIEVDAELWPALQAGGFDCVF